MRTQVLRYHFQRLWVERTITQSLSSFQIMPSTQEISTGAFAAKIVHSLNAMLKSARLYGLRHARADEQFVETWRNLEVAIGMAASPGLTLAVSSGQLLLNAEPVETSAAEQSLRQTLTHAGVSSIIFTPELSQESFLDFVKIFARGAVNAADLRRFRNSFLDNNAHRGIHINVLRLVAADPAGNESAHERLRIPATLMELTGTAARPARRFSSFEFGEELLGTFDGEQSHHRPVTIEEAEDLVEVIVEMAKACKTKSLGLDEWQGRLRSLPENPKAVLREAIDELSTKLRLSRIDDLAFVRLANDVAVRCAVERLEGGMLKAGEVRALLLALYNRIGNLRATLPSRKEKFAVAAFPKGFQADALEREFWASVSKTVKTNVLLSSESWCVPPRNIRQHIKELQQAGDKETSKKILENYAAGAAAPQVEARKRTAVGLEHLAGLYADLGGTAFGAAIQMIGQQLERERSAEVQSLLSAAFLKFSHAAAEQQAYPALRRMLVALAEMELSRPVWTRSLRPRIGFENRIPEFIEDGLNASSLQPDFIEMMRHVPEAAAENLSTRLRNTTRASERERIVHLACAIGNPVAACLRHTLEFAPIARAVHVAGVLSRMQPKAVSELLPERIASAPREVQDEALFQLSIAAAPERGQMLMRMLDHFDSMIIPLALDEIGMCGDSSVGPNLLRLAAAEWRPEISDFIRVKAIEAVGSLRVFQAEAQLLGFVERRRGWQWAYPAEIRVAAAQALSKLDPERASVLLASAELDSKLLKIAPLDAQSDRDFVRSRRYPRVRMSSPLPAVVQSGRGKSQPSVQVLSLEGGLLSGNLRLSVGSTANVKISSGIRPIHLDVLVRFAKPNQAGVETVSMNLKDRSRLRSLLASM